MINKTVPGIKQIMAERGRQTYKQVISTHFVRCHCTGLIGGAKEGLSAKPEEASPSKVLFPLKQLKCSRLLFAFNFF